MSIAARNSLIRRWRMASPPPPSWRELADALDISPIAAALLAQRLPQLSPEAGRAFLQPQLLDLSSPWTMSSMKMAAARLAEAVRRRERIWIHGDYDADGVTATALLVRLFRALGNPPEWFLPSRFTDGYGVAADFVARAKSEKPAVIVTVDCGLSETAKIAEISAAGSDVIIVDHHHPPAGALPPALAVLHTQDPALPAAAAHLTAVGVAFKLAWAVCENIAGSPKVGEEWQSLLLSFLPLAAVGTVADVAPLQGENRILVHYGLRALSQGPEGLRALWLACGRNAEYPNAHEVAFMLAPRLNAAGRLQHAAHALELLLSDDRPTASALAAELTRLNSERQKLSDKVLSAARIAVDSDADAAESGAVVAAGDGWHEGVIGIVASQLVEAFGKPAAVIAFSPESDIGKGSARSIPGLHLYEALAHCAAHDCLVAFGGHEQAAGFKIARNRVSLFRRILGEWCAHKIAAHNLSLETVIDLEVRLADVNESMAREIERFAPFGCGNPMPRFLARGVRVAGQPEIFGRNGDHFRFYASQGGTAAVAKFFGGKDWLREIDDGIADWDIVFNIARNSHYSPPTVELHVRDMRPAKP